MIGLSSLLETTATYGDRLRYSEEAAGRKTGTHGSHGPVVVWNVTRTCNLRCLHCYSKSEAKAYDGELQTEEALAILDQLAEARVPVILFSGGEPLIRPDIMQLAEKAISLGIRVTFSTNGTLITREMARRMKRMGVSYVGISLDGIASVHDAFRRREGAYEMALRGIRNCLAEGQKVGLRFTMNRHNVDSLPDILALLETEQIPRACFYHLVYTGRAVADDDITNQQTRQAVDQIIEATLRFAQNGTPKEILTVDNHADGLYLYLKVKQQQPELAERIYQKLLRNGGNRSGIAICNIDHKGYVHPDQFSQQITLGSLRESRFDEIWNGAHPILEGLRNRRERITGRCSRCPHFAVCNGNFRPRAYGLFGDYWASDPKCYLTDRELGIDQQVETH